MNKKAECKNTLLFAVFYCFLFGVMQTLDNRMFCDNTIGHQRNTDAQRDKDWSNNQNRQNGKVIGEEPEHTAQYLF